LQEEIMRILVIDDDPTIRELLDTGLSIGGHEIVCCETGMAAIQKMMECTFHVILLDVRLPGMDGFQLLRKFRKTDPHIPIIMMTAHSSVEDAVVAMKQGAYHYIKKPFTIDEIELIVERASEYSELKTQNKYLRQEMEQKYNFCNIIGRDSNMCKIFELVRAVAQSRSTVLISGETGTGKELIAKAIHYHSGVANGPFVKINCAALPKELLESELFGYEPGAFTDARKRMLGKFEVAHNGTLLLDEIAEMGVNLQAKLLRVLQEGEFYRVGGNQLVNVQVRIIATTNRDIEKEVINGRFREDLYYRLNIIPINLPSLRERKEDIPLLANYFLKKYSKINQKEEGKLSPEIYQRFIAHPWPGNVRELENCIERAVVVSNGETFSPEDFVLSSPLRVADRDFSSLLAHSTIRDMEKRMIFATLEYFGNNRTKAAQSLGISVRTLRNKLHEYGLERDECEGKVQEEPILVPA
jgi:DNA-binding NtrC family response regulator